MLHQVYICFACFLVPFGSNEYDSRLAYCQKITTNSSRLRTSYIIRLPQNRTLHSKKLFPEPFQSNSSGFGIRFLVSGCCLIDIYPSLIRTILSKPSDTHLHSMSAARASSKTSGIGVPLTHCTRAETQREVVGRKKVTTSHSTTKVTYLPAISKKPPISKKSGLPGVTVVGPNDLIQIAQTDNHGNRRWWWIGAKYDHDLAFIDLSAVDDSRVCSISNWDTV